MSQRTIAEFNHDFCYEIKRRPDNFAGLLILALTSGSRESWEALERFGLRRVVQCHHSDDRKAVVNGHDYEIG